MEEYFLSVLPVLSKFLFVGTHPYVDIYTIFRFKSMRCLSIGVDKMLQEFIFLTIGDDSRLVSAVRCVNGKMRPLKYIKRALNSALNSFFKGVQNGHRDMDSRLISLSQEAHSASQGYSMKKVYTACLKHPILMPQRTCLHSAVPFLKVCVVFLLQQRLHKHSLSMSIWWTCFLNVTCILNEPKNQSSIWKDAFVPSRKKYEQNLVDTRYL